jgi:hypothetical protein
MDVKGTATVEVLDLGQPAGSPPELIEDVSTNLTVSAFFNCVLYRSDVVKRCKWAIPQQHATLSLPPGASIGLNLPLPLSTYIVPGTNVVRFKLEHKAAATPSSVDVIVTADTQGKGTAPPAVVF